MNHMQGKTEWNVSLKGKACDREKLMCTDYFLVTPISIFERSLNILTCFELTRRPTLVGEVGYFRVAVLFRGGFVVGLDSGHTSKRNTMVMTHGIG